jgi:hypothetical protein
MPFKTIQGNSRSCQLISCTEQVLIDSKLFKDADSATECMQPQIEGADESKWWIGKDLKAQDNESANQIRLQKVGKPLKSSARIPGKPD